MSAYLIGGTGFVASKPQYNGWFLHRADAKAGDRPVIGAMRTKRDAVELATRLSIARQRVQALVDVADWAADGDSNDEEIDALRSALNGALGALAEFGIDIERKGA